MFCLLAKQKEGNNENTQQGQTENKTSNVTTPRQPKETILSGPGPENLQMVKGT